MRTPPKRLRRLPHWGRRLRPGEARSAATAGFGRLHATRGALYGMEMRTPPKRLRPGEARSAATAGLDQLYATRGARSATGN